MKPALIILLAIVSILLVGYIILNPPDTKKRTVTAELYLPLDDSTYVVYTKDTTVTEEEFLQDSVQIQTNLQNSMLMELGLEAQ